jgi:hypothetical protein
MACHNRSFPRWRIDVLLLDYAAYYWVYKMEPQTTNMLDNRDVTSVTEGFNR